VCSSEHEKFNLDGGKCVNIYTASYQLSLYYVPLALHLTNYLLQRFLDYLDFDYSHPRISGHWPNLRVMPCTIN